MRRQIYTIVLITALVAGFAQADMLYRIASFNNDGSTSDNNGGMWKTGITTITTAAGITGTNDAGLLTLQTLNPSADTSASGTRFENVGDPLSLTASHGTVIIDASSTKYMQFGITGADIDLASLTFKAARATTGTTVRGYDIDISINGGAYVDLAAANVANMRTDGLEQINIDLTGQPRGVSSVDFRVYSTGGGVEYTDIRINSPAATLTQTVTYNSETITMQLTQQDLRGANFSFRVQNETGGFDVITPLSGERSYIGTVDEYPGAVSCGILKDDGTTFWGAVYFDRGATWFTLGTAVTGTRGTTPPTAFNVPTLALTPGHIGSATYGFDVGFDVNYEYYTIRAGSDIDTALEMVEYSAALTRALYMRDAQLRPYIGRVIIRTSQAHDPEQGLTTDGAYLSAISADWSANHADSNYDLLCGVARGLHQYGGLAGSTVSVNGSSSDGNFTVVWRHEMGHNWGIGHYDGGAPEGPTINAGNSYARMSGPEVEKALNRRDTRISAGILDNEGTYTAVNLPPYAAVDGAVWLQTVMTSLTVDVLANDHDANGDTISVDSYDTISALGGTITQQGQNLVYTAPDAFPAVDYFMYTITDSSNLEATGVVVIDLVPAFDVTPTDAFTSTRYKDIPFNLPSRTYTIENRGSTPLNWTASKTASWFDLSAGSGSIPAGGSVTIDVSLNSGIESLALGTYSDTIIFTDTTNGTIFLRDVEHVYELPVSIDYQAEDASYVGPTFSDDSSGYTGTGYLDYQNASNDYIEWTIYAPYDGIYTLNFRYALSGSDRPLELKVDNQVVEAALSFLDTGGFSTWAYRTEDITVNLTAGSHTVRTTAIGSSGANIDLLQVTTTSNIYEAEDATLFGAVVDNNNDGYTGTGFADYVNSSGDYVEWTISVSQAGEGELFFRYALASGDRPLEIQVNGQVVEPSLSFPATGSFEIWDYTEIVTAALNAGTNTVRATAIGSSGANVDHLYVSVPQDSSAPTGLIATPFDGSVWLDWDDNAEPGCTYNVYRSTTSGSYGAAIAAGLVDSEYTDNGVAYDTLYYYVVTAVNTSAGESDPSNEAAIILYEGDLTSDGSVDLDDVAELGLQWLSPYDMTTFQKVAADWLKGV